MRPENHSTADVKRESSEKQTISFDYGDSSLKSEAQVIGEVNEISSKDSKGSFDFDELTIEDMSNVEFINGHPFENLLFSDRDLNVSDVIVNELIVKNYENYMEIIGKASKNSHDEEMIAESTSAIGNFFVPQNFSGVVDKLIINSLVVDGLFNGLDLLTLNEFALKLKGDQILESEINFEVLKGVSLQTFSLISNRKIDDIVRIESGPFAIDQSVQFSKPVVINELVVNKRLNNININNGKFDILLKRSDRVQVIQTMKVFDEVKLEGPILLQGKIRKSNLNQINPIVSITDNIILEGKESH